MSELKITQNSLENAILKDGLFVSGYVSEVGSISIDASGYGAHAEGYVYASEIGAYSLGAFASGCAVDKSSINAYSHGAHAEGYAISGIIDASGYGAHAEGYAESGNVIANGNGAHAEGINTRALADGAHAGGIGTIANLPAMTAIGQYNVSDGNENVLFVIGNGRGPNSISAPKYNNAVTVKNKTQTNPGAGECEMFVQGDISTYSIYTDSLFTNYIDTTALYFNDDSTVSIPSQLLINKDGNTKITVNSSTNTVVTVNGEVHATGGFYDESDIRKKDILSNISLEKSYELLDKCQEIIYTLKEDPNKKEQVGMIAQEVEEFFPEIVSTDNNGFKSLDYARLSVICLRLIKDIVELIKELKNEIKNLNG